MYYYIFDIKKCKKRSQVENIKSHLSALGIPGEFTYPTAAQNVEELVELGLSKQYTTIVAIGGDEIANIVAGKLVGKKEAMGFIPLEASAELSTLVGTDNWRDACEILRFRKICEIFLGRTATGAHFITNAMLDLYSPTEVTLEFKDFIVQAKVRSLVVANFDPQVKKIGMDYLDVIFSSVDRNVGILTKISSIFTNQAVDDRSQSLFRARSLRIFTKTPVAIVSSGSKCFLAKTPQLIESSEEKLRIITAKNSNNFWLN